jgi:hypothetical protein
MVSGAPRFLLRSFDVLTQSPQRVRRFYVSRTTHFADKMAAKVAVIRAIRAARKSAPSPAPTPKPTFALKVTPASPSSASQFEADLALADDMHPETVYITSALPNVDVLAA